MKDVVEEIANLAKKQKVSLFVLFSCRGVHR